jgi:hypothetical protein
MRRYNRGNEHGYFTCDDQTGKWSYASEIQDGQTIPVSGYPGEVMDAYHEYHGN